MNRRTLGIIFMALMILGIAIPYTSISVTQITYATITGNPHLNTTIVQPGSWISVNLSTTTISGSVIWIWIATDGSAVITPTDAWYIGPIPVSILSSTTPINYTTYNISKTFIDFVPSPKYEVIVYNETLNFKLPTCLEAGVQYWIKITDVSPTLRASIPSSDVGVSYESFTVQPTYSISPNNTKIVPNKPITVTVYAPPSNAVYNITTNITGVGVLYTIKPVSKQVPPEDYNPAWNYTFLNFTFPAYDLKLMPGDNDEGIEFKLVDNATGNTIIYGIYTEQAREVNITFASNGTLTLVNGQTYGNYNAPAFEIDHTYQVNVTHFPYGYGATSPYGGDAVIVYGNPYVSSGTINITLSNETLGYNFQLATNVPLNDTGSAILSIHIPATINTSGYFWLNITDNNGVVAYFRVYVKVVPTITLIPNKGFVGDKVIVEVQHAYDYVNGTLKLLFNVTDVTNVTLAYINVTQPEFNITVTIPQAVWGLHMVYANFTKDGIQYWTTKGFTVMSKIVVEPSCINAGEASFITINATGLNATDTYVVFIDTTPVGGTYGFQPNENGTLVVVVPASGLAPGEHIISIYNWNDYGLSGTGVVEPVKAEGELVYTILCVNGTSLNDIGKKLSTIEGELASLKDLVSQVGSNVTLVLKSVENANSTLYTLIVEKNNEVISAVNMSTADLKTLITQLASDIKDNVTIQLQGIKLGVDDLKALVESLGKNVTIVLGAVENTNSTLTTLIKNVGGQVIVELQDVKTGISDLKALITSLGDDITLKLQNVNNSLATLIVEKNNEVITKICTKLNGLNATIVSIKGDVVDLKTAVGDIQTTLQALKSSNAELKDLIVTKSGEIKGVIETAAGNITTNLNALEQLIKSGLKVDTQTLLSKIDEIKSQLSSISGSVSTVSSKLDQLASTLDDLKSMLSNVQSTVSNVQSTVTDIKSSLQDIKNTANSLASKIESTASDLKSYISSQNSDLKKAVEGISGTVSTYGIISIILIIIAIAVSGYGVYKKKE